MDKKTSRPKYLLKLFILIVSLLIGLLALFMTEEYPLIVNTTESATPKSTAVEPVGTSKSIPIILYHRVLPEKTEDNKTGASLVTTKVFEEDIKYIKKNGYTTVQYQDVVEFVKRGIPLPDNPIIISFDDGYYNNYLYAYPILEKYDSKASLAVIGSQIDRSHTNGKKEEINGFCDWEMLTKIKNSGVYEIVSHTYYLHLADPRRGMTRLKTETDEEYAKVLQEDSQKQTGLFKKHLGSGADIIAFPYGLEVDYSVEDGENVGNIGFETLKALGVVATSNVVSVKYGNSTIIAGDESTLYNLRRHLRTDETPTKDYFDEIFASIK